MPRRHLFVIVVLLGAAAVAGLLAVTRTVAVGSPAPASSSEDAAISFRLQRLDRLEASLRKELASQGAATPAPAPVYRRATAPAPHLRDDEYDEHEDDSGDSSFEEDRDD
jgi:hypothetical protein